MTEETIQRRKLFNGGNYIRKYGNYLNFSSSHFRTSCGLVGCLVMVDKDLWLFIRNFKAMKICRCPWMVGGCMHISHLVQNFLRPTWPILAHLKLLFILVQSTVITEIIYLKTYLEGLWYTRGKGKHLSATKKVRRQ